MDALLKNYEINTMTLHGKQCKNKRGIVINNFNVTIKLLLKKLKLNIIFCYLLMATLVYIAARGQVYNELTATLCARVLCQRLCFTRLMCECSIVAVSRDKMVFNILPFLTPPQQ